MPTYEYECESCKHKFEKFQPIKAKPLRKCPECGKRPRRLIGSGAAVIFKGSGFYQTDYRSAEYKKKAETSAKDEKSDSSETTEKKPPKKDSKKSDNE